MPFMILHEVLVCFAAPGLQACNSQGVARSEIKAYLQVDRVGVGPRNRFTKSASLERSMEL